MKNSPALYILSALIIIVLTAPAVICAVWLKGRDNHTEAGHSTEAGTPSDSPSDANASFVVVIDPGHGGFDPGKVSPDGVDEKDINLDIALKLKVCLQDMGYLVFMTRESDISLDDADAAHRKSSDLAARMKLAHDTCADLYISIHQNSYSAEYVHGAQVFYYSTSADGKALAESIQSRLISDADPDNTRDAKGNTQYLVLADSPCTSVIVECGFLSNADECSRLCDETYRQTLAAAIAAGVADWRDR